MSGIVGIVHFDGKPVDPRLLLMMTDFLTFRGPDAQETWIARNVGFGHTMLRTTWEAEHERQPYSLDGDVWIAADARIDDRQNLVDKLRLKGRVVAYTAPDVELILHAYHVWGEDCAEQLLGDFAFAIWDSRRQHLFCARDHLGIKPFFYFYSGSSFVFSNTLNCLRLHPDVGDRLNDLAIADFLLFELNQNLSTTTFADIQRVPPAHTATVSSDGLHARLYWSLPIDEPIYYKKSADYVDQFKELLRAAVRDRMRTPWIGIFMSGGIDSSTLAATSCELSECPAADAVAAFTNVFNGLIPDDERYYSGLVASRLGIPIHYHVLDHEMLDVPWHEFWSPAPEPRCGWLPRTEEIAQYRDLSNHGRVFFYGEGPDNAMLYEWRAYLTYLARAGSWGRLSADVLRHAVAHRRIPLIPSAARALTDYAASKRLKPRFPPWLNGEFVSRLGLLSMWKSVQSPASIHPVRPRGYASFEAPLWQQLFNSFDSGSTQSPVEVRHPYVDLRLLRYMLAIPALPWCREKHLLRRAMRGVLPDQVLRRPKAPLSANPLFEAVRRRRMRPPVPTEQLFQYVDPTKIDLATSNGVDEFWLNLRPIVLNNWLQNFNASNSRTEGEMKYGFSTEA